MSELEQLLEIIESQQQDIDNLKTQIEEISDLVIYLLKQLK
jgi:cell division septum initiation protein DivIVA